MTVASRRHLFILKIWLLGFLLAFFKNSIYILNISPLPSGKHCLSVYEVDLRSVYCFHYCVEAFSFASVCCALGSYCRHDGQQQDLEIVPLWFRTSLLAFRSLKHWKHFIEGEKQGFSYFLFFWNRYHNATASIFESWGIQDRFHLFSKFLMFLSQTIIVSVSLPI